MAAAGVPCLSLIPSPPPPPPPRALPGACSNNRRPLLSRKPINCPSRWNPRLLWITGLVKGRYLSTCCRNIPSTCARWWKRCVIRDGFVYEAIYEIYSFTSLFVLYLEHVYILRRNRKSFYVATSIRQSSADSTTIPNAK